MSSIHTAVRLRQEVVQEVDVRGEARNHTINRDLERLYTLYRHILRGISLSTREACLITDVMNGTLMDANTAPLLWANVQDAIALDGLDAKWGVNGPALVEKLRSLSWAEALALVDAAERFWAAANQWESTEAGVRKCFGAAIREGA